MGTFVLALSLSCADNVTLRIVLERDYAVSAVMHERDASRVTTWTVVQRDLEREL